MRLPNLNRTQLSVLIIEKQHEMNKISREIMTCPENMINKLEEQGIYAQDARDELKKELAWLDQLDEHIKEVIRDEKD